MKGTHDDGREGCGAASHECALAYEDTLGAIVFEMLRENQRVSRQGICVKLATRIDKATDPRLEAHYCDLLALMLGKKPSR